MPIDDIRLTKPFFMKNYLLLLFCSAALNGVCGLQDTAANHQIIIMTYNIKMLPRGANSWIHHYPLKRARLIPDKLIAENPDIIVFQEAFDGMADRILRKKLKATYPYNMGFQNRKVVSYKRAGGVLMFSKYPMKEIESIKYTQCKGIDCAGHKGAMLVEVEHPAGKLQLLGTHMQAGGGDSLKLSQYAEAGALLKSHEQPGIPQFVAGDFNTHKFAKVGPNTRKNSPNLYISLKKALNAEDGDITGDLQFSTDHMYNDMEVYNPNKRDVIDFIFFKGNGVKYTSSTRYIRAFEQQWDSKHKSLSDHNAVILKMQL
jgi:endonuclease/exonuclease/phosphatase family metal-dependent hydrolase